MTTTHSNSTFKTGHIGLNVSDLERSRDFYRRIFGFQVVGESTEPGRRYAFLALDGTLVLTLWEQSRGAFSGDLPGLHHLSFQVDSMDRVREAETRVRESGVVLFHDGVVSHREGASSGGIFFSDPDGIRLEVFAAEGAADAGAPSADAPTCGFF